MRWPACQSTRLRCGWALLCADPVVSCALVPQSDLHSTSVEGLKQSSSVLFEAAVIGALTYLIIEAPLLLRMVHFSLRHAAAHQGQLWTCHCYMLLYSHHHTVSVFLGIAGKFGDDLG